MINMSIHCSRCNREVSAGEGYHTAQYGFLCFNCSSALSMQVCSICGQRFPFNEMVEYNGELLCRNDYRGRIEAIAALTPKPKPKGPPMKSGTGVRIKRTAVKIKVPYESMAGEIKKMAEPSTPSIIVRAESEDHGPKDLNEGLKELREKTEEQRTMTETEKKEHLSILDELKKDISLKLKEDNDTLTNALRLLKDAIRGKKTD